MARIDFLDIAHSYAPAQAAESWALRPMTMTWQDGGAYALLGPSGCGKTTLLNIISGLLTPTHGRVLFDGKDVTAAEPQQRNIAQVFQFPVIYDSMTVFDNLAFPLRNRKWNPLKARKRVQEIAEILELSHDLQRRAQGLSVDVKQKISLGRGLVRPDVAAILFDEPLTVIDPHLKWLLRRKLKQIHQQLKLSLIYVTHDQTEALTFADQVVVMTQGEVVQSATPEELFERPAHRFVGHFIGSPGMNFIPCSWREGAAWIEGQSIATQGAATPAVTEGLVLGIRPEYIEVGSKEGSNNVPAAVLEVQDQGTHLMAQLEIAGTKVQAKLRGSSMAAVRAAKFAHFPAARCAVYANERRVQ